MGEAMRVQYPTTQTPSYSQSGASRKETLVPAHPSDLHSMALSPALAHDRGDGDNDHDGWSEEFGFWVLVPVFIIVAAVLHRSKQVTRADQQLRDLIRDLLTEAAETGDLRDDVAPDELASYCLHALTAASSLPSEAAVRRLVTVTLAGLRPPR